MGDDRKVQGTSFVSCRLSVGMFSRNNRPQATDNRQEALASLMEDTTLENQTMYRFRGNL